MPYISSSGLHLLTGRLYALIIFSYFPLPLSPGNYQSALGFYEFEFYKCIREMKSYSSCLSLSGFKTVEEEDMERVREDFLKGSSDWEQ